MNTWMDTREKVFAYIREHHMLQAGDRVVAGVSGGADSVCLLFLLLEWQKEVPTDIAVVHVDHGIRAEAGEDARYVEQLCEERGIPFFLTRAEVRNRARMEKISEEEAGRRTRYEAFEKAAKEWGATKIAVAHNSNDRSYVWNGGRSRSFYNSEELSIARMPPMRRMTTPEIVFGIIFCLMRSRIL